VLLRSTTPCALQLQTPEFGHFFFAAAGEARFLNLEALTYATRPSTSAPIAIVAINALREGVSMHPR